jgi:hypothetical protein
MGMADAVCLGWMAVLKVVFIGFVPDARDPIGRAKARWGQEGAGAGMQRARSAEHPPLDFAVVHVSAPPSGDCPRIPTENGSAARPSPALLAQSSTKHGAPEPNATIACCPVCCTYDDRLGLRTLMHEVSLQKPAHAGRSDFE